MISNSVERYMFSVFMDTHSHRYAKEPPFSHNRFPHNLGWNTQRPRKTPFRREAATLQARYCPLCPTTLVFSGCIPASRYFSGATAIPFSPSTGPFSAGCLAQQGKYFLLCFTVFLKSIHKERLTA